MIANGNIVCNSPFLRGSVMPCLTETNPMGKHQVPSGAEREKETKDKNFHCGFSRKEEARQGKHGMSCFELFQWVLGHDVLSLVIRYLALW